VKETETERVRESERERVRETDRLETGKHAAVHSPIALTVRSGSPFD